MAKDLLALADQLERLLNDPKVRARLSAPELAARQAQIATMRANATAQSAAKKSLVAAKPNARGNALQKIAAPPPAIASPPPALVAPEPPPAATKAVVSAPPIANAVDEHLLANAEPPRSPLLAAFANPNAIVAGFVLSEVLAQPVSLRQRD